MPLLVQALLLNGQLVNFLFSFIEEENGCLFLRQAPCHSSTVVEDLGLYPERLDGVHGQAWVPHRASSPRCPDREPAKEDQIVFQLAQHSGELHLWHYIG